MDTLGYSIIFASIRPEIKERVSIGIIFCQGGIIELKYSTAKLNAVRNLVPKDDYNYLRRTLSSMSTKKTLDSVASIDYLSRYSNNILTVSQVRKVKMEAATSLSKGKLYRMYVYKGQSQV